MGKIIAVHSFRGGSGKSNIVANLATLLIQEGKKIGIIDCDIQSPGIHILFRMDLAQEKHTLNDFLLGHCSINETVHEIVKGKLYLIPSSLDAKEIAHILREKINAELLVAGIQQIVRDFDFDYLFIDTHPGLNEETLLALSIADKVLILMRPDQQDYQGTAVTIEIAKKLEVPSIYLVINKVPSSLNTSDLKQKLEKIYEVPLAGVIPLSEDLVVLGSSGIFVTLYPQHEVTQILKNILKAIC